MNNQPTPETDAAKWIEAKYNSYVVSASVSKKLERERNEARQIIEEIERDWKEKCIEADTMRQHYNDATIEIEKLKQERDEALKTGQVFSALAWKLERERNEARQERDALKDAINALHDYVHGKRYDDKDISEILNGAMKI